MGHGRRQILWPGVTVHPTAEWIANQLTQGYGWEQAPRYLIRDRDSCYGVSGRTMARASRALGHSRQIQPNTSLSVAMNVSRFGLPRRRTVICCRSTMISTSNAARDRNRSTTRPNSNLRRPDIPRSVAQFARNANRIQFTTGTVSLFFEFSTRTESGGTSSCFHQRR